MSRHHLTVTSFTGATIFLVAGFDPGLGDFFLSLRDERAPGPGEGPSEEQAKLLNYDSIYDPFDMRSISAVESKLQEKGIPFGSDEQNPARLNPQLLPLLVAIMKEKDSGGAEVGRTCRNWNPEPQQAR